MSSAMASTRLYATGDVSSVSRLCVFAGLLEPAAWPNAVMIHVPVSCRLAYMLCGDWSVRVHASRQLFQLPVLAVLMT